MLYYHIRTKGFWIWNLHKRTEHMKPMTINVIPNDQWLEAFCGHL